MSLRMWVAPVGLFVLQVAPVGIAVDSVGRLRLSVGASLGSYEEQRVGCSGEVLDRYGVSLRTAAAEAEYWVTPSLRVTGYGGMVDALADRPSETLIRPLYEGTFGGALVAWEGRQAGAGLGVSWLPEVSGGPGAAAVPAFNLRFGQLDGIHYRLGLFGGRGPGATPPMISASVAYGLGHVRKIGGSLGFTFEGPTGELFPTVVIGGSVLVPVNDWLALGVTTGARGHQALSWDVGLMTRISLGAPPR